MTQCEFEVCELHVPLESEGFNKYPVMRLKALFFFLVGGFVYVVRGQRRLYFGEV